MNVNQEYKAKSIYVPYSFKWWKLNIMKIEYFNFNKTVYILYKQVLSWNPRFPI